MSSKETGRSTRRAAALRYRPEKDAAPRLTAKGSGAIAEKIIALAREHGIPIQEDPALIQVLAGLDLNQEIPPTVYLVVAEILAFVYSLSRKDISGSGGPR
jgi:flagellar biosynthesis protein